MFQAKGTASAKTQRQKCLDGLGKHQKASMNRTRRENEDGRSGGKWREEGTRLLPGGPSRPLMETLNFILFELFHWRSLSRGVRWHDSF